MADTYLRTYLDRKEQNEVKNIYKKYGWTAVSFNEACAAIASGDEYYLNAFKACCQDPTDENLDKFFCSWRVYQAGYKKSSHAKKECGKKLIPYLSKVLKQIEHEKRKSEMENSLSGLLSADEPQEKWKNKFYVELRTCNNYGRRGGRHAQVSQQRKATFQPYILDEDGKKQTDHYGYAQKLPVSFTIYSNEQGYFDDSVIQAKSTEEASAQVTYYQKQVAELERKIKTLNEMKQHIDKWLA